MSANQMKTPPATHCDGRRKVACILEAVHALGVANPDEPGHWESGFASIREYVDARTPDFPWSANWCDEIRGVISAELHNAGVTRQQSSSDTTVSAAPDQPVLDFHALRQAGDFVRVVGAGSPIRAIDAVNFLEQVGCRGLDDIVAVLPSWQRLLAACDDESRRVTNVLDALEQHLQQREEFPRLAAGTERSDAA